MPTNPWFKIRRVLIHRNTPIGEVPREWLQFVEPRIERGPVTEGDHWFWTGYECRGVPIMTWVGPDKRRRRLTVSHFVVSIFWDFNPILTADATTEPGGKLWFVENGCTYKNCLNPQHLIPRVRWVDGERNEHG